MQPVDFIGFGGVVGYLNSYEFLRYLFLLLCISSAQADENAQTILAASDAIRNPDHPFGLTTTLTEYRNGKQTASSTLESYSKTDKKSGQFRTLLRFSAPPRDTDKLMLKNGSELWFYDPADKAIIRLSPQQRLLGQAANGDVVTVNLAKDYDATLVATQDVQDGERRTRRCHLLALAAIAPDVTYHKIDMWIDVSNMQPVKARFFAESGHILKTVFYRNFENHLGQMRPTEMVIIDGLDPSWVTVMRYSNYVKREVPDHWLQRDYLSHFKPG